MSPLMSPRNHRRDNRPLATVAVWTRPARARAPASRKPLSWRSWHLAAKPARPAPTPASPITLKTPWRCRQATRAHRPRWDRAKPYGGEGARPPPCAYGQDLTLIWIFRRDFWTIYPPSPRYAGFSGVLCKFFRRNALPRIPSSEKPRALRCYRMAAHTE
jgi:hypothetical protein